jgi:hypothetical protein
MLLLSVAGLLSATALLAIGVLLAGGFGDTQWRILATTALLAGYALVALPAAVLVDQDRHRTLALATAAVAALGGVLALVALWTESDSAALWKSVGSVTAFALAGAQVSGLTARRRERDSGLASRLFVASCVTAVAAALFVTLVVWSDHDSGALRLLGSLIVLDLLLVALQPILARSPQAGTVYRLSLSVESGEPVPVAIEGGDLGAAAAKAIRSAEREGHRVVGLQVLEDRARV